MKHVAAGKTSWSLAEAAAKMRSRELVGMAHVVDSTIVGDSPEDSIIFKTY
jgi:hypothetical protein